MKTNIASKGIIEFSIIKTDGQAESKIIYNNQLNMGRVALAKCLAGEIGTSFTYFINRMIFGSNGTAGGVPKVVDASRNGLFGVTVASKPVIATIDPLTPSQVVFTSVLTYDEGNTTLNEMALQMENGDLYSMATFADLNKTNEMQITFNWRICFV